MIFKSIYFRTRGGLTQGWGNIFRLSWFAGYCRSKGCNDITFFVEGPVEVCNYLISLDFLVVNLAEGITLEKEKKIFSQYKNSDLLIMEMLESHYERQLLLKNYTNKLVVFDDLLEHKYCSDLVFCGQNLPDYGNKFISDSSTDFKIGYKYFMAKPEYKIFSKKQKEYSRNINNLLVIFGGGKYDLAYIKTAHAISKIHNISVDIIIGYSPNQKLVDELEEILPCANILGGVDDVARRMWESDFMIVSAGYCKIEAALTKTPSLSIATQWHQIPLGEEFYRYCGMPYLGYMGFISVEHIRQSIMRYMTKESRVEMIEQFKSIDANGMNRTYRAIQNYI